MTMATLKYYPAVVQLLAESGADLDIQNNVIYTIVFFSQCVIKSPN